MLRSLPLDDGLPPQVFGLLKPITLTPPPPSLDGGGTVLDYSYLGFYATTDRRSVWSGSAVEDYDGGDANSYGDTDGTPEWVRVADETKREHGIGGGGKKSRLGRVARLLWRAQNPKARTQGGGSSGSRGGDEGGSGGGGGDGGGGGGRGRRDGEGGEGEEGGPPESRWWPPSAWGRREVQALGGGVAAGFAGLTAGAAAERARLVGHGHRLAQGRLNSSSATTTTTTGGGGAGGGSTAAEEAEAQDRAAYARVAALEAEVDRLAGARREGTRQLRKSRARAERLASELGAAEARALNYIVSHSWPHTHPIRGATLS